MSYTPGLLIKVEDLEKYSKEFEKVSYGIIAKKDEKTRGGETGETVMEFLSKVYFDKNVIDNFGTKCKYCTPNLSSYNKAVRDKLRKMEIDYFCIGG